MTAAQQFKIYLTERQMAIDPETALDITEVVLAFHEMFLEENEPDAVHTIESFNTARMSLMFDDLV